MFMYLQLLSFILLYCLLPLPCHHLLYRHLRYHSMPTLMLKIPQNPFLYERDSFLNSTEMDLCSMVLVELPAIPVAKKGLPPHMVMELQFAKFQECNKTSQFDKKCWQTRCPVYNIWKNY